MANLADALGRVVGQEQCLHPLTEADLADILEIERLGYSHPWSEGVFRDSFRSGYAILGARQYERLDGYGVLAALFDEAHLLNLCVRPDSRGQGLARTLLQAMVRAAALQEMQRLVLEVRIGNRAARRLYESEGFEVIGQRPAYYPDGASREDAVVMALGLAGPASPVT